MRPLLWVSKSTDKLAAILTAGTSEVEQDRLPVLPYHAELGRSRAYGSQCRGRTRRYDDDQRRASRSSARSSRTAIEYLTKGQRGEQNQKSR